MLIIAFFKIFTSQKFEYFNYCNTILQKKQAVRKMAEMYNNKNSVNTFIEATHIVKNLKGMNLYGKKEEKRKRRCIHCNL